MMLKRSGNMLNVEVGGEQLCLLPEKAIILPSLDWLLIADLHLGKTTHFRKNGMAISPHAGEDDLLRLKGLVDKIQPKRVVFLGDLFHAKLNKEWQELSDLIGKYGHIEWVLVKGNHDILPPKSYAHAALQIVDQLSTERLVLTHEPIDSPRYNLHGHIHPGVRLLGKSRQSVKLPCFWFGAKHGVLPAFGALTGLYIVQPVQGDKVCPIVGEEVLEF